MEDESELKKLLNEKFIPEENEMDVEFNTILNERPEEVNQPEVNQPVNELHSFSRLEIKDADGNTDFIVRSTITIEKVSDRARNNIARCKLLHITSGDNIITKAWFATTKKPTRCQTRIPEHVTSRPCRIPSIC
jgi:hypothetical protein